MGVDPAALAASAAVSGVACRPVLPVKALALPEFTTSARAWPRPSLARHHSTGADGHFDRVKTPATSVPSSNTINRRSVRFLYLIPASAVRMRTPSSAGSVTYFCGARGETVADMGPRAACGMNGSSVCPIAGTGARPANAQGN